MLTFAKDFEGILVTETMLLENINTADDSISRLADFLQKLAPDKAYLSVPTRPTADSSVNAPGEEELNRIYQIVNQTIPNLELLTGYEGNAFASTGNFTEDLLATTSVHPMRKEAVVELLGKTRTNWSVVQDLLDSGQLREIEYNGNCFFMRAYHQT